MSTASFVSPSVYTQGKCSGNVSSMPFPGHALYEKGLQRQKGIGPLVGSQERRALLAPVLNRSQTACQPLILFSHSVEMEFCLFVLLERRSGDVSSMPWGVRGTLVSWAYSSVGVPSCPAPPRCPAVRPDPTRPWYVRVLDSTSENTRDAFFPSELFCLTPLCCPSVRPDPTRPLYVRVLDSTSPRHVSAFK